MNNEAVSTAGDWYVALFQLDSVRNGADAEMTSCGSSCTGVD